MDEALTAAAIAARQTKRKRTQKVPRIYAVHQGHHPGIYNTWDEARREVEGFAEAHHRSFTVRQRSEAEAFVRTGKGPPPSPKKAHPALRAATATEGFTGKPLRGDSFDPSKPPVVIYTDGSARPDPITHQMRAGYGVWFGEEDPRNFKAPLKLADPTNNRAELMAAIDALETLREWTVETPEAAEEYEPVDRPFLVTPDRLVVLCIDSRYVIDCVTKYWEGWQNNNWRGNTVRNRHLIEKLRGLYAARGNVAFQWVPGHSQIRGNEEADRLAGEATVAQNVQATTL